MAILEADAASTYSLLRRAVVTSQSFMFNALAMSTVRWAIGTLQPADQNLHLARLQFTTLLVRGLRLRTHPSWSSAAQFGASRHIAKLCGRCWWSYLWDVLLVKQH